MVLIISSIFFLAPIVLLSLYFVMTGLFPLT